MSLSSSIRALGKPFMLLWLGGTVLLTGNQLASFALDVWVLQRTGSALNYSGMIVASVLPPILLLPWVGSIVDRVDRRYLVVLDGGITVLLTLGLAALAWSGRASLWHLYAFNAIAGASQALLAPVHQVLVSSVLDKEQMTRASGLVGITNGILATLSPMAAGVLVGFVPLPGILLFQVVAVLVGTALVARVAAGLPRGRAVAAEGQGDRRLLAGFADAMEFFKQRSLLKGLLAYVAIQDGLIAVIAALTTPLVLKNHSASELGLVMTCAGVGALVGSGLLVILGDMKRLMATALVCDAVLSLCVFTAGAGRSVVLYAACAFSAMLVSEVASACNNALWMRKVPLENQGSVFSVTSTLMMVSTPIVAVVGSYLSENVLERVLGPARGDQGSALWWLGAAHGRGLSLVFVVCGTVGVIVSLGALANRRFRNIDEFVPDGR